jgi:hypothetical protein
MSAKFISPLEKDSDAFYQGQRSEKFPLAYNDIVAVKEGSHRGEEGWIVGLVESEPEARYTVELCSGRGDLYLRLSEIEVIKRSDDDSGS